MKGKIRRNSGSMLVLIVCISICVFIPLLIFVCRIGPFLSAGGRCQNAVDAAALLAANDLSRIVIDDSHFGYLSLSNQPQGGTATRARDGEPLPVLGINTLIATTRQNAILARQLRNQKLESLVDRDAAFLDRSIWDLSSKLNDSLNEKRSSACLDVNGQEVDPVADVRNFLTQNLPPDMKLEKMSMRLGWLADGSETSVLLPLPLSYAQAESTDNDEYVAFKAYAIGKRNYTFAGLGKQSHLVSHRKYRDADGFHINTILRLECTFSSSREPGVKTFCMACSQPYSLPDTWNPGAMVVRYEGRPVAGLSSWSEFLASGNFNDNKVSSFFVSGGDYPLESKARLYESRYLKGGSTSDQFAEHLYYWLRNGRLRPHVDAVISMLNEPFHNADNEVYTYEFMEDGSIQRRSSDGKTFARAVSSDGQYATMADTRVRSGASAIVYFRDNVSLLSSKSGKHGGQPLAGYPLSSSDSHVGEAEMLERFAKRSENKRGLALDIEIGSSGPSTARNDVISMRQRAASRKI